jgi:hypothetical protein
MKPYSKASIAAGVKEYSPKPIAELSDEQIGRIKAYGQVLLGIIAIAGVLTVTAVAPSALSALKLFMKLRYKRKLNYKESTKKVTKSFYYLKENGYIKLRQEKDGYRIILTKKGLVKAQEANFNAITIKKPAVWDGKFWQVAADIPTKYRSGADVFRRKTKELGLFPLQRTLWFYPFDPREEINLVAKICGISSFVTAMKIEKFDPADKKTIKKHFKKLSII